ncbi:UNVERIFIED_CONTAM: immunity protein Imm3 of predicted polymorphic toxin system [Acetivibrio alkalicellulosi]
MNEFTVDELKECLENLFTKVKERDYEGSAIKAAGRCFYEYEPVMNDGPTEKVVCSLIIGKLIADSNNKSIYIGQYNIVKEAINKAVNSYSEFELSEEEKKEVILLAQEIGQKIDGLTIEYDPNAK